jgi:hypothetical protein
MIDFDKETIEKNLLDSMKAIDNAIYVINKRQTDDDDFDVEISKLLNAKNEVKRVLNKSFDECARNRKS